MATATRTPIERNLAMELVRATETGALNGARWMGRGDKNAADDAAVRGMRQSMATIGMEGVVVIGEGEKDEAPMLYIGEKIGDGRPPAVDIAVDPIDGTTLTSKGLPGAISVIALTERGQMFGIREIVYMNKIAVGPEAVGSIDITASPSQNLRWIAKAKRRTVNELTVCILDRPRHKELMDECRAAGARIKLIPDGDVAGGISAALEDTGVDVLMGVGGAPEAVLTAAAIACLGGEMQCTLWPRDEGERAAAEAAGFNMSKVYEIKDMVGEGDIFFAATGVTDGELLRGVRFYGGGATTQSIVMRSYSGTVRTITTRHNLTRMGKVDDLRDHIAS
jgi:fructose-1,6-bisphosphatase II